MNSFQETTILKSFKATGISPFNPKVILQRFAIEQDSHKSSTSEYNGEDWRKIERLVRSTVEDQSSREARKLSSSLHHISVQNKLLHSKIKGLRKALSIKKKHEKKSKPLDPRLIKANCTMPAIRTMLAKLPWG